jgi:hypothetical protein
MCVYKPMIYQLNIYVKIEIEFSFKWGKLSLDGAILILILFHNDGTCMFHHFEVIIQLEIVLQ